MRYACTPILAVMMLASCFTAPVAAYRLEDLAAASVAYGKGDYAAALRLLRPLANEGSGIAQSNLGTMYKFGWGVPQDCVQAHMWFNLSAAQGGLFGDFSAAERDDLASKMTAAQVAEAQRLAREWKPK
jgi:TPR repeat protein